MSIAWKITVITIGLVVVVLGNKAKSTHSHEWAYATNCLFLRNFTTDRAGIDLVTNSVTWRQVKWCKECGVLKLMTGTMIVGTNGLLEGTTGGVEVFASQKVGVLMPSFQGLVLSKGADYGELQAPSR